VIGALAGGRKGARGHSRGIGVGTSDPGKLRLCMVVTYAGSLGLARGQFAFLRDRGFEVTAVSSPGKQQDLARAEGARTVAIPMERKTSIVRDLRALWRLYRFFRRNRFDVVNVSTPKAGLLGTLAARLTGHKRIVYVERGIYYETAAGLRRALYERIDKLVCRLASRVIPVSHEMGDWLVTRGICPPEKIRKIGCGSSNGVDSERFRRTPERVEAGRGVRQQWEVPEDGILIGTLARLVRDKGVEELVRAFVHLADRHPNAYLMLVGRYESDDFPPPEMRELIETHPRIRMTGWQQETERFYAALDIFALPTYREGFPNTVLEASAMELPVVTTDIMGCREAIVAGATGLGVPPRNWQALADALDRLIGDADMRRRLGAAGRRRVVESYQPRAVWNAVLDVYLELFGRTGRDNPSAPAPAPREAPGECEGDECP